MYTQMNALAAYESALSNLNGWEIGGIVVVLVVVGVAIWMLPEFIRYMRIRHM